MWKQSVGVVFVAVVLVLALTGQTYGGFNALKDPALVGWWACDEGAGEVVADSSPNGNDGTFINGDPAWTAGVHGMAIELTNPTLVEIPAADLSLSEATWAGWILAHGAQAEWASFIMHRGPGPASGFNILADNRLAYHWGDASNTWSYRGDAYLVQEEWTFCAVVVEPEQAVFYVNGAEISTNSVSHPTIAWDGDFWIGGDDTYGGSRSLTSAALDDVSFFSRALTTAEVQALMQGLSDPALAGAPEPADEATDIPRDADLSWKAGDYAASHDIYLGMVFDDVNDASRANPMGVLLSEGQSVATVDPGRLEFGQTYYWRVDEVNGAPDNTIFKGDVWSFTVEPFAYPVQNITVTSNAVSTAAEGPENTINGSGLNADDEHSIDSPDMWLGKPGDGPVTLEYEFDGVYKLHEMQVWNYNVLFELLLGFGLKDVTIEYSENGADWTVLGDVVFAQATATSSYTANTTVAFDGVAAKFVKITVNSAYGTMGQYGLSEVRFLYIPVQAREPQPADGDADVSVATALSWRAGREAASHDVSLGTDPEALASAGTVSVPTLTPAVLDLETTYYWQVTEVNDAEAITAWAGTVWSFTTQLFLVVDDFESYIDDEGGRIYETWIDGYGVNSNGSQVGHIESPFAEQTIVKSGAQSMPLFYNNAGASVSEAEIALTQSWTGSGVKSFSLQFYGAQDNTGTLYVKINGTKVAYDGAVTDIAKAQWQVWNIDLSSFGGNLSNVTSLTIGVEGAGAAGVVYIDDIRLYPKIPQFITPVQPDAAGLVLHYAFDDGAGMVAADSSGNGNAGTLDGDPTWITGAVGGALDFDGTRDYVDSGVSLLSDLAEFTIACWLKGDLSLGNRSGLIGQNDCVEYGVVSSNTVQIYTAGGGTVDLDWPYDADAGWHHIVAVGDGSSVTIYLDGKPAISGGSAIEETYGASTYPVNVAGGGIFDAADNWFTGQIDEVRVYQRALSAAEVAGLAGRTEPVAQEF